MSSKSVNKKLIEAHYSVIDFLTDDKNKRSILQLELSEKEGVSNNNFGDRTQNIHILSPVYVIFNLLECIYISETHLFKRKRSLISEETMNLFDSFKMHFIETYPDIKVNNIIPPVVKAMQFRCRRFKKSINTEKVVEWYFKNVFSEKFSIEQCNELSHYNLSQLLFNISFINYDLTKIEKHMFALKEACIERIKKDASVIPPKELVLIISSIYRMNLIFLREKTILGELNDI